MTSTTICLLAALAAASAIPSFQFPEHVNRIIRSEDTDGYDIATLHVVDTATNEEIRQSRRDLAEHADASVNEHTYSLHFSSGEQLRMPVQRRSIDFSGATFTERTEDGRTQTIDINLSACFFSGELENEEGFVSLSLCDGKLVGSVTTPSRDYEIQSLPHPDLETDSLDGPMQVLVTWQNRDPESVENVNDGLEIPEESETSLDEDNEETERRSATDHRGTIEICDVVDSYFIENIQRKLGISNSSQIIQLLISKWSSAAHMLSNKTEVGWDLTLRLVRVEIWRSHPDFYKAQRGERLGARLGEICVPTQDWHCDQLSLHTGATSDVRIVGLAWVGGLCSPRRRCSALRSSTTNYMAELHELGHTMGLKHDPQEYRCTNGTDPVHGFMGGNRNHFRECYKEVLERSLPKKTCIFTNVVNTSDIIMDFSHH